MRCCQMFDQRSETTDINHTSAESWNYGGENAKNRFWICQPIEEEFVCSWAQNWWNFKAKTHFSKMSKFSAKRHESLKRLANWTILFRMVIKTHLTRKTSISVSMTGNIWLGRQEPAWVSLNGTIWRGFKWHQEDGEPYNTCMNVEG